MSCIIQGEVDKLFEGYLKLLQTLGTGTPLYVTAEKVNEIFSNLHPQEVTNYLNELTCYSIRHQCSNGIVINLWDKAKVVYYISKSIVETIEKSEDNNLKDQEIYLFKLACLALLRKVLEGYD